MDSREHYHGPFKSEGLSLNAKEGYDSPDGYCKSTEESPDASVPTNISFPNHDADDYTPYESPVSALNHAHHDEPPQLPEFHRAETNRSDVANSSSNSSSHDTSATSEGWMRHFNSLVRYKEAHGDCDVPQKHKEGEDNLGVWVNKVSEYSSCTKKKCFDTDLDLSPLSFINSSVWKEGNLTGGRSPR